MRNRRLMRLRITALPIFLVTVKPKRDLGLSQCPCGLISICNIKVPATNFLPLAAADRKSLRFLIVSRDNGLSGKALAAFGPAGVDDPAAPDGGHACTETVAAFANEIAGLERAFHGKKSLNVIRLRTGPLIKEGICNDSPRACQREYGTDSLKEIFNIYSYMP